MGLTDRIRPGGPIFQGEFAAIFRPMTIRREITRLSCRLSRVTQRIPYPAAPPWGIHFPHTRRISWMGGGRLGPFWYAKVGEEEGAVASPQLFGRFESVESGIAEDPGFGQSLRCGARVETLPAARSFLRFFRQFEAYPSFFGIMFRGLVAIRARLFPRRMASSFGPIGFPMNDYQSIGVFTHVLLGALWSPSSPSASVALRSRAAFYSSYYARSATRTSRVSIVWSSFIFPAHSLRSGRSSSYMGSARRYYSPIVEGFRLSLGCQFALLLRDALSRRVACLS